MTCRRYLLIQLATLAALLGVLVSPVKAATIFTVVSVLPADGAQISPRQTRGLTVGRPIHLEVKIENSSGINVAFVDGSNRPGDQSSNPPFSDVPFGGRLAAKADDPSVWFVDTFLPDTPGAYYWQVKFFDVKNAESRSAVYRFELLPAPTTTTIGTTSTATTPTDAVTTTIPTARPATTKSPRQSRGNKIDDAVSAALDAKYPDRSNQTTHQICKATNGKFTCKWIWKTPTASYRGIAGGTATATEIRFVMSGVETKLNCTKKCTKRFSWQFAAVIPQ